MTASLLKWYWLVRKDLVTEMRARQVWPVMLLLGAVVVLSFAVELNVAVEDKQRLASGFLWLAVFFAGFIAMDRSFAREPDDGALDGLLSYPVSPSLLYLAKLAVNLIALLALESVVMPLFTILTAASFWAYPSAMLLTVVLADLGIVAIGTLLSAITAGTPRGSGLLAVLVLPLAIPIVVAAAEATRLGMTGELSSEWSRWVQLLAAFAVIFITAGVMLFDFLVEE